MERYQSGLFLDRGEFKRGSLVFLDILSIFEFGFDVIGCLGLAIFREDLLSLFEVVL
jgi:hypothetical protein